MIRQYLSPIAMSLGASLLILFLSVVPYAIYNYRKRGQVPVRRTLIGYSFIWYLVAAYFLVILPLPSREAVEALSTPQYNLEPFIFVEHFLRYSGIDFSDPTTYPAAFMQPTAYIVYFNLLLMVPLGVYLRKYFGFNFYKTLLAGFLLSLFFEVTQLTGLYGVYPRPYRIFNVDDLLVNTLGALVGFWISPVIKGWTPELEKEESFERIQKVTIPRRLLAFGADLVIITGLYPLAQLFLALVPVPNLGEGGFSFAIAFIVGGVYFIGTAIILKKQTLGMALVKITTHAYEGSRLSRRRMIFRHLLFLLWFPGPLVLLEVTSIQEPYISFLFLAVFVILGSGALHIGITLARKERGLFYERISKTFLKSLN